MRMLGPAPSRDVDGAITTPGARALSRLLRFGAADFESSSAAEIGRARGLVASPPQQLTQDLHVDAGSGLSWSR